MYTELARASLDSCSDTCRSSFLAFRLKDFASICSFLADPSVSDDLADDDTIRIEVRCSILSDSSPDVKVSSPESLTCLVLSSTVFGLTVQKIGSVFGRSSRLRRCLLESSSVEVGVLYVILNGLVTVVTGL